MQITLMNWCFQAKVGPKRIQEFESYYDYLRNFWKTDIFPKHGKGASFDKNWQELLQTGSIGDVVGADSARSFSVSNLTDLKKPAAVEGWELVLYPTSQLGDGAGSQANMGWIHELPDPITKAVWDNYASISMAAAAKLKVKEGCLIEITVGKDKIELPVLVQPGLQDDVIAIAIGYGRTHVGSVGNGIGKNAYALVQTAANGQLVFAGAKADVKVTGKKYEIAHTQTHHSMEGRQIVVEATLNEYQAKKDHIIHKHPIWSVWSGHQYNGHKWGMAIDLNSCTGCSACMTDCQSENNIPVVGKTYVMQGREMHWIRIDRYYTGNPTDAHAEFQPVMCQHCDNAPGETVCPVLATVHSSEGLNEMVYNRCVGTRYCSNNCPYKVRRFNWFPNLARFELEMHERAEKGQALTASDMTNLTADLFSEGFGPDVAVDRDRVGITWAQFQNLYANFYVYQYATGISGAHALAEKVIAGQPAAAANYLNFLKAGSSVYPLNALKIAGVDLTTPEAVETTFAVLAGYVDRLEQLLGF